MKRKSIKFFAGLAVFISMTILLHAQTPVTPNTVPTTPSPYPVPPSPVVSPNQVPQDPTIPKVTIPIHAPTDSVFRKIDDEDKPFKLQRPDTASDSLHLPRK